MRWENGRRWIKKKKKRDFLGNTVVKTSHFHSGGHRFYPWVGKYDPTSLWCGQKEKKEEE